MRFLLVNHFKFSKLLMKTCIFALFIFIISLDKSIAQDSMKDTKFELKLEGLFWRLDSTDSNGNKSAVSTSWAARVGLAYLIPFDATLGFRPELGGSYGKFENPTIYNFSNASAASSFVGGSLYSTNIEATTKLELRYFYEQSIFSKNTNSILSLNQGQTHRIAVRGSTSFFRQKFQMKEIIVGVELSKPFTNSTAFGGVSSGFGWGVFLRSGFLLFSLVSDHYPNFGKASNSTQLSVGIDGLKLGF